MGVVNPRGSSLIRLVVLVSRVTLVEMVIVDSKALVALGERMVYPDS